MQPSMQKNKKKSPAKKTLDLSQFESPDDKKEKKEPSDKEPPKSMKLQPIVNPDPTEVAKTKEGDPQETSPQETDPTEMSPLPKEELGEAERAAMESLIARGANIRMIDGHAFSLLAKRGQQNK